MQEERVHRRGINTELYKAIASPPGWVEPEGSQYFLKGHLDEIRLFLNATTDSVRLVRASNVSRKILSEYDMAELEDLRSTVQASELLHVIPYPRQTDHSAHTLYLYLLGVYLFFACAPLRAEIASFLNEKDESPELTKRFHFLWVFVSLLHDIGYIFQGRSKSEIRAVDRMFRPSTITNLMDAASEDLKQSVRKAITGLGIRPFEPIQNPEDMLSLLRDIPWGKDAGVNNDIFDSFNVYGLDAEVEGEDKQLTGSQLETYAYQVASSGYDGLSEGTVDHAVASGLFLFRYSTFWYWLANEHSFRGPFAGFRRDYDKDAVASACFASAAHNLIGIHGKKYGPLILEKNPLIYLGVLCDELQKWDRFPAGERHLIDLKSFEEHCTDSERIKVFGNWDKAKVVLNFDETRLADRVAEALGRLDSPERFVEINPPENTKADPSEDSPVIAAQPQ